MRSYLEVMIDVKEGKEVDKEELRVALLFCRDMLFFAETEEERLIEGIKENKCIDLQATLAQKSLESRFENKKNPLEFWWGGIENIPKVIE